MMGPVPDAAGFGLVNKGDLNGHGQGVLRGLPILLPALIAVIKGELPGSIEVGPGFPHKLGAGIIHS